MPFTIFPKNFSLSIFHICYSHYYYYSLIDEKLLSMLIYNEYNNTIQYNTEKSIGTISADSSFCFFFSFQFNNNGFIFIFNWVYICIFCITLFASSMIYCITKYRYSLTTLLPHSPTLIHYYYSYYCILPHLCHKLFIFPLSPRFSLWKNNKREKFYKLAAKLFFFQPPPTE